MKKYSKHRPIHIFTPNSPIFITARIYHGFSYLCSNKLKDYFWKLLSQKAKKHNIKVKARVVLNNHYHLIVKINKAKSLPKFIKELHGASSRKIKLNLPDLVTEYGQLIVKQKTPHDYRQDKKLKKEFSNVIAQFIARNPKVIADFLSKPDLALRDNPRQNVRRLKSATTNARRMNSATTGKRRMNSATTNARRLKSATTDNVIAHFSARLFQFQKLNTSNQKKVLAQFIARLKHKFRQKDYRRLKSAITKEIILDPELIIALASRQAPIWHQYQDHVLRSEKDFYMHLNYIHQNPVKHGLVKKMSKYKWSSIHKYIEEKGKEWIIDCFREYPIIDFNPIGAE